MIDTVAQALPEINPELVTKLIMSVALLFTAMISSRIFTVFWNRWNKKIVSKTERKRPEQVSELTTKMLISRRIIHFGIYFFTLVLILLQFDAVRSLGAGLLASAGIAGIVIGMASKNTLSNFMGGIYLSFSQPVRLNDAVIFDGEFGWIEDIGFMYTTIRTWDNRRIIVPNDVMASKVIQNWTIKDPSLLGVIMLYVDYTCDLDQLKEWVKDIVEHSQNTTPDKISGVQVIDFTDKTMAVRILVKGANAPKTWDLRCEVREKLTKRFREEGIALPLIRIEHNTVEMASNPPDLRGDKQPHRNPEPAAR